MWPQTGEAVPNRNASFAPSTLLAWDSGRCVDPHSWVWSSPRAERVAVELTWTSQCEIGSPGCNRQPESADTEPNIDETATAICELKSVQHESSNKDVPFDNESCLAAERAPLTVGFETLPPLQSPENLSCNAWEVTCQALPPLVVFTFARDVQFTNHRPVWAIGEPFPDGVLQWPHLCEEARDGVRRRVDRPPTHHPLAHA